MKVVVEYTPGHWGASASWSAKFKRGSKERVIEDIALNKLYSTLQEELPGEELEYQYLIYGQDFTKAVEEANDLRRQAEELDRRFKANRIKLVREMRDTAPEKGYPVTWEAMAQLLGYQVSTVVTFSKENPAKYEG